MNALKTAFPGARQGLIRLGLQHTEARICVLCVADNGVGLPADLDVDTVATTVGVDLVREKSHGDREVEVPGLVLGQKQDAMSVVISEQERAELRQLADAHETTQSDYVRQFIRTAAAKLRAPESSESSPER